MFGALDVGEGMHGNGISRTLRLFVSDALYQLQQTVPPMECGTRMQDGGGDISEQQLHLLALHAYGALRVVEEVQTVLTTL